MSTRALITDDRGILNQIEDVEFTDTWSPHHHKHVMGAVDYALRAEGIDIREESFTLTGQGLNMFAILVLDVEINGGFWQIGIRNSMNKLFRIGMCGGKRVTVCTNLIMSGAFVTMHKHSKHLDHTKLKVMAIETLDAVKIYCEKLNDWLRGLHNYPMTSDRYKCLTYDCIDQGVFVPSKWSEFHEKVEKHGVGTLHDIHDAVTRMNRGRSYFKQYDSCKRLNNLLEEYHFAEAA